MIEANWALVTGPTQEPLTLEEAKQHLAISQDDDNALLAAYLTAAREAAQQYMGRALFTQTWKMTLSDFADEMLLPMAAPLASVTTVQYYDENGVLQTLSTDSYTVDTVSEPGRVLLAAGQSWPSVQSDRRGPRVIVTYVCGWADVALIPELIKQGMRLYLASAEGDRVGDQIAARRAAESQWAMAGCVYWRPPCHG